MQNNNGRALQKGIQGWWEKNPMTYDWRNTVAVEEGTHAFYDEIDERFWGAAWFAHEPGAQPFSKLIDYAGLSGKRVLEVGCGAGAISAQFAKSGADITAIDLTSRAVALTRRRFEIFNLPGDVRQMDAERLEFPDGTFDFVWSWGVIHHSANTGAIVAEMCRVLKPGGEAHIMVYHRRSMNFWVNLMLIRGLLLGGLLRHSVQGLCDKYTDGLIAKYYTPPQMRAMCGAHFRRVETEVYGQKNEVWQISPGALKNVLVGATPDALARWLTRRFGGFLLTRAVK